MLLRWELYWFFFTSIDIEYWNLFVINTHKKNGTKYVDKHRVDIVFTIVSLISYLHRQHCRIAMLTNVVIVLRLLICLDHRHCNVDRHGINIVSTSYLISCLHRRECRHCNVDQHRVFIVSTPCAFFPVYIVDCVNIAVQGTSLKKYPRC